MSHPHGRKQDRGLMSTDRSDLHLIPDLDLGDVDPLPNSGVTCVISFDSAKHTPSVSHLANTTDQVITKTTDRLWAVGRHNDELGTATTTCSPKPSQLRHLQLHCRRHTITAQFCHTKDQFSCLSLMARPKCHSSISSSPSCWTSSASSMGYRNASSSHGLVHDGLTTS